MAKNHILIITKEKENIALQISNYKIEIKNQINIEAIIKRLNNDLYDSYRFILIKDYEIDSEKILHYFPINLDNEYQNHIFINEIDLNPIIIKNIELFVDEKQIIYISILIRHIIRNNLKYSDFKLKKELENIRKANSCSKHDIELLFDNIEYAVRKHYTQNSIYRLIRFNLMKEKIIKVFIFKILNNIFNDIKDNTYINKIYMKLNSI